VWETGITVRITTDDAAPARPREAEQNRDPNSSRKQRLDAWVRLVHLPTRLADALFRINYWTKPQKQLIFPLVNRFNEARSILQLDAIQSTGKFYG
jgi:hypothetical protein